MRKILIVTDSLQEKKRMEELLYPFVEKGGELLFVKDQRAADLIQEEHPKLIITNLTASDKEILDLCKQSFGEEFLHQERETPLM